MRGVYLVIGVVVIALGLGGVFLLSQKNNVEKVNETAVAISTPEIVSESDEEVNEMVDITVDANEFNFDIVGSTVKAGESVKLILNNKGKMRHNWVIEGMEDNIKTKLVSSGGSDAIGFVIDEPGEYTYYCNVPGHRSQGMVGTLVVE